MNQIQKLEKKLTEIGFIVEVNEYVLQIVGLSKSEDKNFKGLDIEGVSHVLQVVIELDDPLSEGKKFLFQDCSLKVYFEGWDLQEAAKIIKLNIAAILDEHGVFEGMGFTFPKDYNEVLVP